MISILLNYLVVGNNDHDDGRPHLDDLVQGLHVGGGPVVGELELLWISYSHAEARTDLLEAVHKLGS